MQITSVNDSAPMDFEDRREVKSTGAAFARENIRDARHASLKVAGYSISYRNGHVSVRIELEETSSERGNKIDGRASGPEGIGVALSCRAAGQPTRRRRWPDFVALWYE
jgi:hypothetical protein